MNTTPFDAITGEPEQVLADRASEQVNAISADAVGIPVDSPTAESVALPCIAVDECLGQRLRAAREACGLSCEEAAQRLKLPITVVRALEAERYDRIGQGIYLRGYLTKYLQLLGLPQILAERVVTERIELPPLITSGTISRPRYLFDRYSVSALYLILTGVIVVPAILLAMHAGLDPNLARIAPLDLPEVTAPASTSTGNDNAVPATTAVSGSAPGASTGAVSPTTDETPLVASMTPFPAAKAAADTDKDNHAAEQSSAAMVGAHSLRLTLVESSWVEVVTSDGQKLEFGLLPAGATRSYNSDKSLDVRLGNCSGATVEIDGKSQDFSPYRHSNVAHFKLMSGESTISHSGG